MINGTVLQDTYRQPYRYQLRLQKEHSVISYTLPDETKTDHSQPCTLKRETYPSLRLISRTLFLLESPKNSRKANARLPYTFPPLTPRKAVRQGMALRCPNNLFDLSWFSVRGVTETILLSFSSRSIPGSHRKLGNT